MKINSKKIPKFDERHNLTVSRNSRSPKLDKCKEKLARVNYSQPAKISRTCLVRMTHFGEGSGFNLPSPCSPTAAVGPRDPDGHRHF